MKKKLLILFSILYCFNTVYVAKAMGLFVNGDSSDLYKPAYHFSPDSNWINDPNGLVYRQGKYHLFYQYNPFSNKWGHMSWGHSVSSDLMNWKKFPVALAEDKNLKDNDTSMIFSGSAVNDIHNTSGFGNRLHQTPMVAIYTALVHQNGNAKAQFQDIAYSNDEGLTWTRYSENPVLDIHSMQFRDPKVFWYAPKHKWVMAVSRPDIHEVFFYSSYDLRAWNFLSSWGGKGNIQQVWECPDLVEIPIAGSTETKWVLIVSAGNPQENFQGMQYFVGDFDGTYFNSVYDYSQPSYLDYGKDFYAAVSFNDAPDNKKIIMGWLNNWQYADLIPTGTVWRGAYSIPRELSLKKVEDHYVLFQKPVAEFERMGKQAFYVQKKMIDTVYQIPFSGNSYEMDVDIEPFISIESGLKILKSNEEETIIAYHQANNQLSLDRTKSGNVSFSNKFPSIEKASLPLLNKKIHLKILVDKSIVEIFANNGAVTITDLVFPKDKMGKIELYSKGGKAIFSNIQIHTILKD